MSAAEIISEVQKLPREKVFELARWLKDYEAELWDQQIEEDVRSGKLDKLGEQAVAEHRAGKTRRFPE